MRLHETRQIEGRVDGAGSGRRAAGSDCVVTKAGKLRIMKAHSHSAASVSIHVRDLSQMFSSLGPSPFWDRELDHNAAAFIEGVRIAVRGDPPVVTSASVATG
jgi:hypothetical protein